MSSQFIETYQKEKNALKEDVNIYWSKHPSHSKMAALLYMLTCHGLHIMLLFRLGKIVHAIHIPILGSVLKAIFQLIWFLVTTFYGIWINLSSEIGKGFYIGHYGAIIIHGDFGDYCSVGQGVTVGTKGAGKSDGHPKLENNVFLSAGAKVIGNIHIGSNVTIGANAVVITDIPANTLAVGIPAKTKPITD